MVGCGITTKSVLVAIVLMALAESGLAAEKLATCCEKVTRSKITEPILGYLIQIKSVHPCVDAVIFQTAKGLFCAHPAAPWVALQIRALRKDKPQTTASPSVSPSRVSLLSMITSTAPLPAASTAETPVGKNMSAQIETDSTSLPPADITQH